MSMNGVDSLNRIKLLMGYKVGLPLTEQKTNDTLTSSYLKNYEGYSQLPELIDTIDDYWKLTNVNPKILKLIEILKEFSKVDRNVNSTEYNAFNLEKIKNVFFKENTLPLRINYPV